MHPNFAARQPTPDLARPGSAGDPNVMVTADDDENTWHAQVFRCAGVPVHSLQQTSDNNLHHACFQTPLLNWADKARCDTSWHIASRQQACNTDTMGSVQVN